MAIVALAHNFILILACWTNVQNFGTDLFWKENYSPVNLLSYESMTVHKVEVLGYSWSCSQFLYLFLLDEQMYKLWYRFALKRKLFSCKSKNKTVMKHYKKKLQILKQKSYISTKWLSHWLRLGTKKGQGNFKGVACL